VSKLEALDGVQVREYHVVVRGRVKEGARKRAWKRGA
jgi:hypothetical protein